MSAPSRGEVQQLLGVTDPGAIAPADVLEGPVVRHRGLRRRHLVLVHAGGTRVPCFLLTPDHDGPFEAGVVAVHQHDDEFTLGKSEVVGLAGNNDLAYGEQLARMGLAVVAPDLAGFEERRRAATGDPALEQSAAWQLVAKGDSLQARHVRDIALVCSWLQGSGLVAGDLGIVGHSLGGQVAFFSMAVDPRLRVGVISCGIGTLASFEEHGIRHNPAWFVPRLRSFGDVPAVASALVGQRVLVSAGRSDRLFPWDGVEQVVAAFADGVCDFRPFDGGHAFPAAVRTRALDRLRARLLA